MTSAQPPDATLERDSSIEESRQRSPREAALDAHAAGLCVVPPKEDGSKAPLVAWKAYMKVRPSEAQLDTWYGDHGGVGLVCGSVSGGLEMLEFEGRAVAEGVSGTFLELADRAGLGRVVDRILAGYQERTPSGGLHLLYRVAQPLPNTVLARRPATAAERVAKPGDPLRVLIETRGEGGYVIVAPSGGRVHPDGGDWTLETGGFDSMATITTAERDALFEVARALDDSPAEARGMTRSTLVVGGDRPGDRFNASADIDERMLELLLRHGWSLVHRRVGVAYLRRPGKETGVSATLGHAGAGVLHVFSTSTVFEPGAHAPFGVYAMLEHGGDFAAAARTLRGETTMAAGGERSAWGATPSTGQQALPDDDPFLSPAQVYDGAPPVEWVVPGLLAHGSITNLDAKPKMGKTTLALMLVSAALDPDRRFLGRAVEFDRVIYLTEQGRDTFKAQLAMAGIGRDVVERVDILPWGGVHALPWEGVLELVRHRVGSWPTDTRVLLVVDTFSKWSRISDENDATAAMAAYRPLVLLTQDLRLATLVLRHARKGDHEDATDTARGSNAASGEADIILTLGRPVGRPGEGRQIRHLRGVGRWDGIPDEMFIELRDGEYVELADGSEVQAAEQGQRISAFLARSPWSSYEETASATGITRSTVETVLAALSRPPAATVVRSASGRKGDPYRFALVTHSPGNPSLAGLPAGPVDGPPGQVLPASRGPFPGESHAQVLAFPDAFPGASRLPPETPSEQRLDEPEDLWVSMPELPPTLLEIARATFGSLVAHERTVAFDPSMSTRQADEVPDR